ncbi:MAG: hypothetical protein M0Z52_07275 [Actinomycetota bacterium]|nr:hypothetical protein [Actinomycetota bacterium]
MEPVSIVVAAMALVMVGVLSVIFVKHVENHNPQHIAELKQAAADVKTAVTDVKQATVQGVNDIKQAADKTASDIKQAAADTQKGV